MRLSALLLTALVAATAAVPAQAQNDADRSVANGGISVPGWMGRIDRRAASQGKKITDSKFTAEGAAFRLSIGPAGDFWNPANTASGDYEVMGTFKEHKMTADHPHSYGIFIGGNALDTDTETLMYCIVYANGTYSVKTFHGANVVTLVNMEANPAVVKADANGQATNTVGWRVRGGQASCLINGQVVKTFDRAAFIAADKLTSTDGVWGIRVSHNLELTVSGLMKH